VVRQLLALPQETAWVEDKHNNSNPQEIGEYLSALSNSAALEGVEHGYLIWGISDGDRTPVGTAFQPASAKVSNEDLEPWLARLLTPQIHFEFQELELDGKRVVLMSVERARTQPTAFKQEPYIRIGSYKKKLRDNPDYARRLYRSFDATAFEDGLAAESLSDTETLAMLDYPSYFTMVGSPLPEGNGRILAVLAADDLVKPDETGRWNITNLGAIMFARSIDSFPSLRRKAVRVVLYAGNSKIETEKEQVITQGYANGFENLIAYINSLLPSNEVIGRALRTTLRMYPDLAVRELTANALIHQDFSLSGTGPMIEIFSKRIEITNPGTPLIDPLRFVDSPPRSRNEKLASLMRRCGVCEERGSGWDKIASEIDLHQLPAPLVGVTPQHTRVTLFSHRDLANMDRDERVRAVYLHACLRYVIEEKTTNASVRERFKADNYKASRMIKEAVEQGLITQRDPSTGRRYMEYVPWWAADRAPLG
jgi:predicted HTH transcriptional regulator